MRAIALLMALTALSSPQLAPAPFKSAPPGSVFEWQRSGVMTSTEIVGPPSGYRFCYRRGMTPRSFGAPETCGYGIAPAQAGAEFIAPAQEARLAMIWPLAAGKAATYKSEVGTPVEMWENRVTVIGTDTVSIGDRRIAAYVVEWKSRVLGSAAWYAVQRIWYAPSLGWNVRIVQTMPSRWEDRVVRFTIAPRR